MELFLRPPPPGRGLDISSAVIAVLAGEVEGRWAMRWRMELFFWLVKLQSLWPLAPRISFAPDAPRANSGAPALS